MKLIDATHLAQQNTMDIIDMRLRNLGTVNKNILVIEYKEKDSKRLMHIYYSYETPVAFVKDGETICRENDWGPTTGKLLNEVEPDKKKRISGDGFEKLFKQLFN